MRRVLLAMLVSTVSLPIRAASSPEIVATNRPPDCGARIGQPFVLWPPNHGMAGIDVLGASGVSDPDGDPVEVSVVAISQDEPVDRAGDGNSAPDAAGLGSPIAQVRRERSGQGNGRVYEVTFEARDSHGASCSGSIQIAVPGSRDGPPAVDDGQKFDSTLAIDPGSGCGDAVLDPGERCDDGLLNSDATPDACRTDCTLPRCGDAILDSGEGCDDGDPANPNDGCDASCLPTTWIASLVSGKGPSGGDPHSLDLNGPERLARDVHGNIYIADTGNHRVLRVFPDGFVSTIAGKGGTCPSASDPCGDGGPADGAAFGDIRGIAVDSHGHVYVSEANRNRVRKINVLTNTIETVVNADGAACADPTAVPACGDEGVAGAADLNSPSGMTVDMLDRLYIADLQDYRVRRVLPDPATGSVEQTSRIETVAGNGTICSHGGLCGDGGQVTQASTNPVDVAVFVSGMETRLYIADYFDDRVREVIVGGTISNYAGAIGNQGSFTDCIPATAYVLQYPQGVAVDDAGNVLISDLSSIYRVDRLTRTICRVAGRSWPGVAIGDGGPSCDSYVYIPTDVLVDPMTGDLIIANAGHHRVRRVLADGGVVHECQDPRSQNDIIQTVVGSGLDGFLGDGNPADTAPLRQPTGLAVNAGGVYIGERGRGRIRLMAAAAGTIATVAGTGSGSAGDNGESALEAKMDDPAGIGFDSFGNLYFVDAGFDNNAVRKIDTEGRIWTVAGVLGEGGFNGDGGAANSALLSDPRDITIDAHNNLYISDAGNDRIRRVNAVDGQIIPGVSTITTVAGGGTSEDYGNPEGLRVDAIRLPLPNGLAISPEGTLYFSEVGAVLRVFEIPEADRADIYVNNTHRVRAIAGSGARCAAPANLPPGPSCGDFGPALSASFRGPEGLAYDPATGDLFLADRGTWRVKRLWWNQEEGVWHIDPVAGTRRPTSSTTFSGDGGPATEAVFFTPSRVALDHDNGLLVTDSSNGVVRRIDLNDGTIRTIAGAVFPAGDRELERSAFGSPVDLTRVSPNLWLVSDATAKRIRAIDPSAGTGRVFSAAGYPTGFAGDEVPARYSRKFANPSGVAYDGSRYVYVSEMDNHTIRRIDTLASPWTIETWVGLEGVIGPLNRPGGLVIDQQRSLLYVADTGNNVVRSVDLADPTNIRTVAGQAQMAGCPTGSGDATGSPETLLSAPVALAMNQRANDSLYVVDEACHMVRRIDLSVSPTRSHRIIGDGTMGRPGDGAAAGVHLSAPRGAAIDGFGNLHVTSRNAIVTVASGPNRLSEETDWAGVIYGKLPWHGLEQYTDCLTGISVVNPGDGDQDEMFVLDRCLGSLVMLRRSN